MTENGTYVFEVENNAGSVTTKSITIQCIVKPTPAPTLAPVPGSSGNAAPAPGATEAPAVNKDQLPRNDICPS